MFNACQIFSRCETKYDFNEALCIWRGENWVFQKGSTDGSVYLYLPESPRVILRVCFRARDSTCVFLRVSTQSLESRVPCETTQSLNNANSVLP